LAVAVATMWLLSVGGMAEELTCEYAAALNV
jgi:hypothetical protein